MCSLRSSSWFAGAVALLVTCGGAEVQAGNALSLAAPTLANVEPAALRSGSVALRSGSVALRSGPVALQRRPVAGERLVHAFVLDHTLVAQRMATRIGSEEQLSQDGIELGGRTSFRFADEVREVEGPRATLLRRVVEDATVHVDMRLQPPGGAPRTIALDGGSPLTGTSVLHRYVPARDVYGKLYDGQETSEEFLPRLFTDIALTCLLPAAPVEVGAQWTVAPARLVEVFAYGGLVPIRFAKGADPLLVRTTALGVGGPLFEVFGGEVTGTVGAELVSVEAGIARIALRVDVRAVRDQTALNQANLTPPELYDGTVVESGRAEWSFRGQGELRWNVDAGRAEALSLAGAEEIRLALALKGPTGKSGSDLALAGGLKLSIDIAVAPKSAQPR